MNNIRIDYQINDQTMALLSANALEYETIVWEKDRKLFIKEDPMQLIEQACLQYGSTYDGRKEAVIQLTGFKRRTPVPISILRNIYAFPTHSPSDHNCNWFFSNHVQLIHEHMTNKTGEARVVFNNETSLSLPLSTYSIQKQLKRTAICQQLFTENYFMK